MLKKCKNVLKNTLFPELTMAILKKMIIAKWSTK